MASFSIEERNALYSLFTLDEHEVREGSTSKDKRKIQWFTYVRREAIQTRLDSLFFGEWELYFLDPKSPAIYHNSHVDCSMGLAIRGIRREYNGSQSGGGEYGAKGAATDALKRVASLWGIGLYLQQSPQIWTENYRDANNNIDWKKKDAMQAEAMKKVSQWLKSIGATGEIFNHSNDDSPSLEIDDYVPSSGNSSASKGLTKQQAKAFSDKWTKVHLIPVDIVLAQLGVSKLSEFDGTLADAEKQMDTYLRISSEVDKGR